MTRLPLLACLLLAETAPGSDCRLSTGPDGLCPRLGLEPFPSDLRSVEFGDVETQVAVAE